MLMNASFAWIQRAIETPKKRKKEKKEKKLYWSKLLTYMFRS